jgi:uncharacterized protein (TIGR00369 family)
MQRVRTVTWDDPTAVADWAGRISGLEFFAKLKAGELPRPPALQVLDIEFESFEKGKSVFSFEPAEFHYNPIGVVHGGVIATLLDSAVGCAVHTALPAGVAFTTLELKVNYIRPGLSGTGRIRAEGTLVHLGRKSAVAEGRAFDSKGRVLATASTTCLVYPAKAE